MEINIPKPRGRPRAFVRDNVLDRAVIAFWERGYSGSSLDNLTDSMGINRPSLYTAFGSKHDLFMDVIDRYAATLGCVPFSALKNDVPIRQAVAGFFELSIRCATTKGKPRGCLIANVATIEAENNGQVKDKLAAMFADTERAIADYFRAAKDDGRLPGGHEPKALARMVTSVTHSIATRARAGASRHELSVMANDFVTVLFP